VDLIQAVVRCEDGTIGRFCLDYGARGRGATNETFIAGDQGIITIRDVTDEHSEQAQEVILTTGSGDSRNGVTRRFPKTGIHREQELFFDQVKGSSEPGGQPVQVLQETRLYAEFVTQEPGTPKRFFETSPSSRPPFGRTDSQSSSSRDGLCIHVSEEYD
jgi:hypothetical protein